MIDREYGKYFIACDICGEEFSGFNSFDDVIDYKKAKGWESDRGETLDLKQDDWIDICPDCVARGK